MMITALTIAILAFTILYHIDEFVARVLVKIALIATVILAFIIVLTSILRTL